MKNPATRIAIIVVSQFACTSLWFAANAVIGPLASEFSLPAGSLGHLTSAVQFGFIAGTLVFAALNFSDRFSPSKVFFLCSVAGAAVNLMVVFGSGGIFRLLALRFITGFFLAGIYPVGMKIASDYFEKGLGKALGFLVGALVLGTSLPHLLRTLGDGPSWRYVIVLTSAFAALGGLSVFLFVPDGPYRKKSARLNLKAFYEVFRIGGLSRAAFGYFGHMWELFTFWAFTPFIISAYIKIHPSVFAGGPFTDQGTIAAISFIIIGSGCLSCIMGGYFSTRFGSQKTAFTALLLSCICCLVSPLVFFTPPYFFLAFMIFWGMAVVADSPQFSALVASSAPDEFRGTALTIVNSAGFAITIVSIEAFNMLMDIIPPVYIFMILAPGPVFGMIAMTRANSK